MERGGREAAALPVVKLEAAAFADRDFGVIDAFIRRQSKGKS